MYSAKISRLTASLAAWKYGPSDNLVMWAIGLGAGILGWVGFVMCILALKCGSGTGLGIIGMVVFLLKIGFLIARRM